jgi:hypothetical protein
LFDKQDSECFLPFYLSKFKGWQDSRDFLSKDLFLDQDEPGGYDKILRKEFITDSGLWEVKFVPYSHALKATVRLSLANWKAREGSKQAAKICGKVVASNNLLRECAKTVLFNLCPHDEPLTVSVNQTVGENELIIPLLRPIVVVPYVSIFKVAVNIWLHPDDDDYDANNFTIVNNAVFFPAELSGEVQQSISGELGDIQVTVAWSHRISVTYCLF